MVTHATAFQMRLMFTLAVIVIVIVVNGFLYITEVVFDTVNQTVMIVDHLHNYRPVAAVDRVEQN